MDIEIQCFFLAGEVIKDTQTNAFDARMVAVHSIYPVDGCFPFETSLPYFLLLRRATHERAVPYTLHFGLVDQDGRPTGSPRNFVSRGMFPATYRFLSLHGSVQLTFPGPGDYRLRITGQQNLIPTAVAYTLEVTDGPTRPLPKVSGGE